MAGKTPIEHVRALTSEIVQQNGIARQLVAKSLEVLRTPLPDTFLGRKTQEPFPRAELDSAQVRLDGGGE
jgi:hypothetical protein